MLPTYTKAEAASAIRARLAANAAANVDRVGRVMLDALSDRLRRYLAAAEDQRTPPHYFNQNWCGPALADLIRQCEAAVEMGAMEDAA